MNLWANFKIINTQFYRKMLNKYTHTHIQTHVLIPVHALGQASQSVNLISKSNAYVNFIFTSETPNAWSDMDGELDTNSGTLTLTHTHIQ